ncbi:MAG: hypothetical protein A2268_02905 [Candidatus Raymondbacteria bacterium RifOxyA12_full_50_37]|uniref:PIG-L family deacetylase n=1 Tax=Candidatus Raymondbacteria bacterium RIFOXYD12_FULL_49_13 TaxID=1817890 RepID=A0A1F7F8V1_UNCRA|nr:MAG: hypothetical protein A2248_17010 [Candidatus Raymondbacteria bacterium RIFOXYA2_FULL_49_16]OGJ90728.1 MAG: hypothetical protein A2268_02905 [Candidatus Raymondbacteria bacterium RifOxyA12_full_50_37]OGJ91705.1 MAG: hypothetical protein A2350_00315 [Candidatus Raymondbacteria bacterium RifOxyB12_full_50_8]OGJ98365.1 MAG: hypothetical protein A2453_08915 [Candidatus Raymondbacteria bacterium RIFOXYC2_FULL_50_21]OGK03090.1 MAG: hypothetical protein A2519_06745 [Candidatus Raymondbacteria b
MVNIARVIPQPHIRIISPHYDDAPLTFGGYLLEMKKTGAIKAKVMTVVNVFSRSIYQSRDDKGNRDKSLKRLQFVTGIRLFEDMNCLDMCIGHGCYTYELMTEPECLLRGKHWKSGEKFEFPWGNRASFTREDREIYTRVKKAALTWLLEERTALLVPMAMKEHIDHVIVREAVFNARKTLGKRVRASIYFGEDQPYTGLASPGDWRTATIFLKKAGCFPVDYAIDSGAKYRMIEKCYPTQVEESYRQGVLVRAQQLQEANGARMGLERMYRVG